jgi:hypothetical protein
MKTSQEICMFYLTTETELAFDKFDFASDGDNEECQIVHMCQFKDLIHLTPLNSLFTI